ncbi:hypothetical protein BD410DRAFT_864704 [Rickenella mellea]|uniref:Uncharacterized protein n=1 Tax=Rickenella mellea TaxID=50990 RepID=A0A4Y7Q413_9AGAM|nr:hypothetical protein BD410DRAFT_864704 [Rickenella mellea]
MSSHASISWGFIVPKDKLVDLLECFLRHANINITGTSDTETNDGDSEAVYYTTGNGGSAAQDSTSALGKRPGSPQEKGGAVKKQKFMTSREDATDLFKWVEKEMANGGWDSSFRVIFTGDGEYDGDVELGFVYGTEFGVQNAGPLYGTVFSGIGSQLLGEDVVRNVTEDDLEKFQTVMHLAEVGIELPLKEHLNKDHKDKSVNHLFPGLLDDMGVSSEASLGWGFIVPSDKLLDLLDCFLKHAKPTGDTETKENDSENVNHSADGDGNTQGSTSVPGKRPGSPKEKEGAAKKEKLMATCGEAEELFELVEKEMSKGPWDSTFRAIYMGADEGDWDVKLAFLYGKEFSAEKPGYGYGTDFDGIGPRLLPEDVIQNVTEADVQKFQEAMHLGEIGLELPLQSEWIISISVS